MKWIATRRRRAVSALSTSVVAPRGGEAQHRAGGREAGQADEPAPLQPRSERLPPGDDPVVRPGVGENPHAALYSLGAVTTVAILPIKRFDRAKQRLGGG